MYWSLFGSILLLFYASKLTDENGIWATALDAISSVKRMKCIATAVKKGRKHNRSCTTYRHIRTSWMSSCYRACSNTLTKISTSHFPQWMGKNALMFLVRNIVILLLNREMDRFITLAIDSHRSSIGIQWKWLTFVFDTLQWWWKTRKTQTYTHTTSYTLHAITLKIWKLSCKLRAAV